MKVVNLMAKSMTGYGRAEYSTEEVDVSVENGNIVIKGADNAMIEVYSLNGQCVYSGIETTISIAAKGLYVVKVNGKSFKVKM